MHLDPNYDRLDKIRPVISAVQQACRMDNHGSVDRWSNDNIQGEEFYEPIHANETNKAWLQCVG